MEIPLIKGTAAEAEGSSPEIVIERTRGWRSLGLGELWKYRELVYFMVWREIKGTYRQTALGASWLFLRPVMQVAILSLVFGRIIGISTGDLPYPLFSLAALIPWGYFNIAVLRSASSLVEQRHVISKVYFPRLVLPISATMSGLIDLGASLVIFLGAMAYYRMPLRVEMLTVPAFLFVAILCALAMGLWLATLSVKYRDVQFAVNFILLALMYLSPVIYPINMVPESFQFIYKLNPMTGVIGGFRWALLGSENPPGPFFGLSILILVIALISGAYVFRRTERTIVDIL